MADSSSPANTQEFKRLDYLDSIRGGAALLVLASHCWLVNSDRFFTTMPGTLSAAATSPSNLFFYGLIKFFDLSRLAVITFFVLSGFVLAYSLLKNPVDYAAYAFRRFFRIYPAFLFVVLVSYALHFFLGFHDVNSSYLRENGDVPISGGLLARHLFMLGTPGSRELDSVVWSLVHEMRISLIFPFILLALRKYGIRAVFFFWGFSALCGFIVSRSGGSIEGFVSDTFLQSLEMSGAFVVFFAGGAWLALERDKVAVEVARLSKAKLALFLAVLCVCIFKSDYGDFVFKSVLIDHLRGICAMALIALTMALKTPREILSSRIPVWFGRISYSLYLVHLPVLYVITQTFGASWTVMEISVADVLLSLVLAEGVAKFIEFPSIGYGKSVSGRLLRESA